MNIILASTSPYRRALLSRVTPCFETCAPSVDETLQPSEAPSTRASRLALAKARAVAHQYPDALVIGSDQVAWMPVEGAAGFDIFRKPGTRERAIEQLLRMQGKSMFFDTAVCVLETSRGNHQLETVRTEVRFRSLSEDEIVRYVDREQPLDCAGAAKVESLGIALLEYVDDRDPTALIGLPLITLCQMLRKAGVSIP